MGIKVYLVPLLAAIVLAVITSAANIRDVEDGQEDTQAVVEGQLGWIAETDNQLGEIRKLTKRSPKKDKKKNKKPDLEDLPLLLPIPLIPPPDPPRPPPPVSQQILG